MTLVRPTLAGLVGLGLAITMTACSSTEDTADASAAYCSSAATVQSEVAKLKTLVANKNTTVDEVKSQREAVSNAQEAAKKDAEQLAESVKADVKAADEAFDDALKAIPGEATIAEAKDAYTAAIKSWDAAMLSIRKDVGCK